MISVVINTFNAEKYLQEVLDSVKDFDEIIVCDMESNDRTVAIAEQNGCKLFTFPRKTYKIAEPARDYAIHLASHSWVLVIDADEIVTPELRQCLYEKSQLDNGVNGYYISRCNKFMGKYLYNNNHDYILRFFRHEHTTWPPTIHSIPEVHGKVERLPEKYRLMHLADETVYQWVDKMNDYTDSEIERKADKNYGIFSLIFRPIWRFIRNYFFMGGFRNGRRGILQAFQWAIYQQIMVSKVIEKQLREKQ